MPLPDALAQLEAILACNEVQEVELPQAVSAVDPAAASTSHAEGAVEIPNEARECMVCWAAPREVRFQCGHGAHLRLLICLTSSRVPQLTPFESGARVSLCSMLLPRLLCKHARQRRGQVANCG